MAVAAQAMLPSSDRGGAPTTGASARRGPLDGAAVVPSAAARPALAPGLVPLALPAMGDPATGPFATGRDPLDGEAGQADLGPFAPGLSSLPSGPAAAVAGAQAPAQGAGTDARALAAQLAEAFVAAHPDGSIEIGLRPEELGRVRMIMTPDGGNLTVTLVAERPETLDLMRRTIDTLASDLRDLGYSGLNFRFDRSGQPGGGQSGGQAGPQGAEAEGGRVAAAAPAPASLQAAQTAFAGPPGRGSARLDIRM
jgi:hypothetical protein